MPQAVVPTTDFSIDVLDSVISELDLVEATLVGISKGGGIVLGYTVARSDRVTRLVLVDSYGLGDTLPGGRKTAVMVKTRNSWRRRGGR